MRPGPETRAKPAAPAGTPSQGNTGMANLKIAPLNRLRQSGMPDDEDGYGEPASQLVFPTSASRPTTTKRTKHRRQVVTSTNGRRHRVQAPLAVDGNKCTEGDEIRRNTSVSQLCVPSIGRAMLLRRSSYRPGCRVTYFLTVPSSPLLNAP